MLTSSIVTELLARVKGKRTFTSILFRVPGNKFVYALLRERVVGIGDGLMSSLEVLASGSG